MLLFVALASIISVCSGAMTFGEYCLDPAGQLKKEAGHPSFYYWNVHKSDMLMTCPPTTVWYQKECICMTLDEIEEENPEEMAEFRSKIEKKLAETAAEIEANSHGINGAEKKLLLNFDEPRNCLKDDSPNHAYSQRRKNVRCTRRGEGVNGNAAKFRGGYLKIPMFNNFMWGSQFSVSFWIKPDVRRDGFYGVMDNAAVGCRQPSSFFIEIGKQGPAGIELYVGLRTHIKLATMVTYLPLQMLKNYIHVVVSYDGELAETYINGKVRAKESVYGDVLSRNCPFVIGYSRGLRRTLKLRGLMDQISLMMYVPTRQEVRELYTTKKAIKKTVTSLTPTH